MGHHFGTENHGGSSPLARGLRKTCFLQDDAARIIPARAGFTELVGKTVSVTEDHPRSRGVYSFEFRVFEYSMGSSPLARGLRIPAAHHQIALRIIPARAGFT